MSDDLVEWLTARIAEDEERAREMLIAFPTPWELSDRGWMAKLTADGPAFRQLASLEQWPGQPDCSWLGDFIRHLDGWNPDRVLVECDSKRRIIAEVVPEIDALDDQIEGEWGHGGSGPHEESRLLLKLMALPYVDREGYREEWRP